MCEIKLDSVNQNIWASVQLQRQMHAQLQLVSLLCIYKGKMEKRQANFMQHPPQIQYVKGMQCVTGFSITSPPSLFISVPESA